MSEMDFRQGRQDDPDAVARSLRFFANHLRQYLDEKRDYFDDPAYVSAWIDYLGGVRGRKDISPKDNPQFVFDASLSHLQRIMIKNISANEGTHEKVFKRERTNKNWQKWLKDKAAQIEK